MQSTVNHAVKGLQNGGIYKVCHTWKQMWKAVKGLQNGSIYKYGIVDI